MKKALRFAGRSAGDIVVAALAVVAAVASFGGTDDSAYLFPRLIAAAWLGLCVLHFVLRAAGAAKAAVADFAAMRRAAPGAAIIAVYAALAEAVGFYFSALCAFLALATLYDPKRGGTSGVDGTDGTGGADGAGGWEGWEWKKAAMRIAVACVIIVVLRLVFSELLRVQTPRGALF